ncbi:hypothetical protein J1N35_036501 [Gossypium stocksii]|uniref:RNase H type-1 domain-containing protein n=1 Tax=Gossypium stocksii TaxID=47602 RepID=A0A9D3UI33_9ROSI|nr:hypothetical protein J1N35_036501 [Gossypium stocksii]
MGVKFNTYGSCDMGLRRSSSERLLRDSYSKWLFGFLRNLGTTSPLLIELWAVFDGLPLSWNKGYRHIVLEIDYLEVACKVSSTGDEDNNIALVHSMNFVVVIETANLAYLQRRKSCFRFLGPYGVWFRL